MQTFFILKHFQKMLKDINKEIFEKLFLQFFQAEEKSSKSRLSEKFGTFNKCSG